MNTNTLEYNELIVDIKLYNRDEIFIKVGKKYPRLIHGKNIGDRWSMRVYEGNKSPIFHPLNYKSSLIIERIERGDFELITKDEFQELLSWNQIQ